MQYYNDQELREIENELIELGMFTEEEVALVVNINGFNAETFDDMIYARYGYYLDDFAEEIGLIEEED